MLAVDIFSLAIFFFFCRDGNFVPTQYFFKNDSREFLKLEI